MSYRPTYSFAKEILNFWVIVFHAFQCWSERHKKLKLGVVYYARYSCFRNIKRHMSFQPYFKKENTVGHKEKIDFKVKAIKIYDKCSN